MVKYLKENFFVRYRRFDSFAQVNQLLEQWMADVADRRELRQFRQTPEQRFTQEQEHLQPLPEHHAPLWQQVSQVEPEI